VTTPVLLRLIRALDHENLLRLFSWEAGSATGTQAISAVFGANAIPCMADEPEDEEEAARARAGLFRYASRINHSCAPNAGWMWCEETKMLRTSYVPRGQADTSGRGVPQHPGGGGDHR
jgi:hypothetical protein